MSLGRAVSRFVVTAAVGLVFWAAIQPSTAIGQSDTSQPDMRPLALVDQMESSPLKKRLLACSAAPVQKTLFSIGHRGAPLGYAEHTVEGYRAAAQMGAGIVECDVTFTSDKELVCRHAQNDLHTTTNILTTEIARTCIIPFQPATSDATATAECRTSEVTLEEFRRLTGKRDAFDASAETVEAYITGPIGNRILQTIDVAGTLMTHRDSIALFKSLGVKFAPELKSPAVEMPFDGFSQQDYAQKLIDEYKMAGVPGSDVWAQSFNLDDVLYWIENEPEFGAQAIFLDNRFSAGLDPKDPSTFEPSMSELKALGVNYLAPPIWMLLSLEGGEIKPSAYANSARDSDLKLIAWTLERSGPLDNGGGWYYKSVTDEIDSDGKMFDVLDVLAQDVGVVGVFSDWPATVSFYASCMGLN